MQEGTCLGIVQELEQFVLTHGTKLRSAIKSILAECERVLSSIKHVTVNELIELVETIARVNPKYCSS